MNRELFSRTLNSPLEPNHFLLKSQALPRSPNSEADRTLTSEEISTGPSHGPKLVHDWRVPASWNVCFVQMGLSVANLTVSLTLRVSGFNPNWSWPVQPLVTAPSFLPGAMLSPCHLAGNYLISWNTMKVGLREERRESTMVSGNKRRLDT